MIGRLEELDGFHEMKLDPGDSMWDEVGLYRVKTCPFCGEPPDWTYRDDEDGGFQWMILCQEKTCHVMPWTSWTDEVEFAALKWNRRFSRRGTSSRSLSNSQD